MKVRLGMRFVIRDIRSRPRYFLRLVEKEVEGRNVRALRGYKRERRYNG